ncbi:LysR family transcriptional regulator [Hafnia paralvei]|uniref:LysR family transcriptional regulator n=1 Tax=Hafnia paralvei TaxID=546367 RepID=UPI003C2EA713
MDKLKGMQAFVAAVETGSFAAAADKLSLSPQRVAKAVSQLEEGLSLSLLNRTTRQQSLTEFGQIYYQRCRDIINQIEAADALAFQMKNQPEGNIRISAPTTFGNSSLVDMIGSFLDDFPAITITLELSDHLERGEDNLSDVAFRIGDILDPGRIAKKLTPYQLVICASPTYLAKYGIPNTPEELVNHSCLLYTMANNPTNNRWLFAHDGQTFEQEVPSRLRINGSQGLLTAALAGRGIILAPQIQVKRYLASGELLPILENFNSPPRPFHLLYSPELNRRAKIQVFIDAAVRWFSMPD